MFEDEKVVFGESEQDAIEYTSVSRAAVLAPLFGLASIIALFHPLAWAIPATGVAVSLFALGVTTRPEFGLVGKKAALAGLALCMFFGIFAVSRWTMDRRIMAEQSQEFAGKFLEFVQNRDLARAIECTQTYMFRQPPSVPLAEHYVQNENARKLLANFREKEVVQEILAAGSDAKIDFVRVEGFATPNYGMQCWSRYRLTRPDMSTSDIIIGVSRNIDREAKNPLPHWTIRDFDLANGKAEG